jgi:MFS family permease
MIEPERRGLSMSLFALGPIVGPAIGPTAGGFLILAKGWRWVFWLWTIVVGPKPHSVEERASNHIFFTTPERQRNAPLPTHPKRDYAPAIMLRKCDA